MVPTFIPFLNIFPTHVTRHVDFAIGAYREVCISSDGLENFFSNKRYDNSQGIYTEGAAKPLSKKAFTL